MSMPILELSLIRDFFFQLYNQSLQFAPPPGGDDDDDEENASMAIAFANRSAVWMDRLLLRHYRV